MNGRLRRNCLQDEPDNSQSPPHKTRESDLPSQVRMATVSTPGVPRVPAVAAA
jgi:hypothetical protein